MDIKRNRVAMAGRFLNPCCFPASLSFLSVSDSEREMRLVTLVTLTNAILVGLSLCLTRTRAHSGFGVDYCDGDQNQKAFDATDASRIRAALRCCAILETHFPENVHWPSSTAYDTQQQSYYSGEQASLSPACRVSPSTASDVSTIITVARENHCQFAVRTGGHGTWNGASNIGPNGFTIDMQMLRGVDLSLSTSEDGNGYGSGSFVAVGAGCRWTDVYAALRPWNLTVVGGRVGDVGVAGFLLGGGIGFLSSEHGFGSDNVLNYEVVLADGSIVNANTEEHADLFWAFKLGSTNFGIVTRFDLAAFPQGQVWGGSRFYAVKDARDLLDGLVSFTSTNGNKLKGFFGLLIAWEPTQKDYIVWSLQTFLEPVAHPPSNSWPSFKSLTPLVDMMGIRDLVDITEEFKDADPGKQGRSHWLTMTYKADAQFHMDIHAKGVEIFEAYQDRPGVQWGVGIQATPNVKASLRNGGNPARLSEGEDDLWVLIITTNWIDPADDVVMKVNSQALLEWAENEAQARGIFHPYIYMNYAYGGQSVLERSVDEESLRRMREVKMAYDSSGVLDELWPGGFKLRLRNDVHDRSEL
ncbi:hypothetical protein D9758_007587 [Tetrapyrgos nigripes]|uniref:FAD-binding PCMH-type domain-containing protein n=1 Tax=Tetrapyrgos nigripes TaxID=182062 RepID=A0A8H5LK17_9AGAR|nr:hypothetical protein D9758_007587 [Tetrapyrgos nigripes]